MEKLSERSVSAAHPRCRMTLIARKPDGIRVSCVRCGALDHGSEHPSRRWVETPRFMESTWQKGSSMKTTEENNKKLVLEAFDPLFNNGAYWPPNVLCSPIYFNT